MRKFMAICLAAVALLGAACGSDDDEPEAPEGAQSYAVDVDANADPKFQISAYFPGVLTVRPGDTIVFDNKSKAHPHTITFGIKADNSNRPPLFTDKGDNPVAFGPCFTDQDSTPQLTACPTPPNPAAPPEYAGKGYWNSGLLSQAAGPTSPQKITLKLASTIAPGNYQYLCLLHPFMIGSIKVAESDEERETVEAVRTAATEGAAIAIAGAAALKPPAAIPGAVSVDWGNRLVAVMDYDPKSISVKVGEFVTWKNASPYEPHTVTFESPFKTPGDPGVAVPAGVKFGGTYTGGFTSSGFFGPQPIATRDTFVLKFGKAGTYQYVCTIHPGMAGTVVVT